MSMWVGAEGVGVDFKSRTGFFKNKSRTGLKKIHT